MSGIGRGLNTAASAYFWHTAAVRWRPWLLLPTGGLPSLDLECRFAVAREGLGVANATVV
jgi:hypothetical protein